MWFIFPQHRDLGHSQTAKYYGIGSLAEAEAYLRHPILGPRLVTCTQIVNHLEGITADQIFGFPDNLKFRSSMTLFGQMPSADPAFQKALVKYFGGQPDPLTLKLLGHQ